MSNPAAKGRILQFLKDWGGALLATAVGCALAPFWIVGAVCGALWWAIHDGFMEGSK